jgi:hypothetical protein
LDLAFRGSSAVASHGTCEEGFAPGVLDFVNDGGKDLRVVGQATAAGSDSNGLSFFDLAVEFGFLEFAAYGTYVVVELW